MVMPNDWREGPMIRTISILLFVVFLFSCHLFAQRQNGAIDGSVQDMEGHAIPGVTVTVSSPSLIGGNSIAFSDSNGYYRFPVLAPGTYEARAELGGFQTMIRNNIGVAVGKTLSVNFNLEVTGHSEALEVTGKPPFIDVSTTAVSFTVPPQIIENLPKIQKIQFLMALTPGVSDDLVAFGADGERANSVWVDGVNVSNPRKGNLSVDYNYNWIDEVQVTGIGAPAEYGGFTGVIGNFITRSGGNQFHGLFETFFQNQNMIDTNTPDPPPKKPFKTYDLSAQLGGPVVRDKLWFFSGIEYPHTATPTPGFDEVKTDAFGKLITKLTYKINQNNTLQGFGNWNNHSLQVEGSNAFATEEANFLKSENPQSSWNATWISLLTSETTLESRFGGSYDHFKNIEDNPDVPGHLDLATGIFSINTGGRENNKRVRLQLNAAVSHHAQEFIHGSHDFRFGVEFERSNANDRSYYNGGIFYLDYDGAPYLRSLFAGYEFDGSNDRVSSYAEDEWNISDRINLSLGVRWDDNRGYTDRGLVFANDPVAPRIGFVWLLNQKSQTVIKAHYGDYYDALVERYYFFLSDGDNPDILQQYIDGAWTNLDNENPFVGLPKKSTSDLKEPYVRQFTVGIDRVLPGNVPLGAHYIYRRWGDLLEDVRQGQYEPVPFVNPLTGETITVYNLVGEKGPKILTNPPGLYRQYNGLEFFANKQFSRNVSLSGSLVLSKLTGNYFSNTLGPPVSLLLDDPNYLINRNDRLMTDRTVSWKVVGTYLFPWGFNTGFYFRHESGNTWTPTTTVTGLNQGPVGIFLEPSGSRRLPSRNLLDMRVEKEFPISSGQLRLTLDVFNVFNSSYVLGVDSGYLSPNFGQPTDYNQPRQIQVGVRYTF
jgi:Carboxypeptidase regulatory-like domain/TonB dependent receptor-like, beta-barrel